jgi:hypothetical protein
MSHFFGMVEPGLPFVVTFPIGSPPVSGLVPGAQVSKNGAAFVATTNNPVEIGGTGYYKLALTAADLDTVGTAVVEVQSAQPPETLIIQVRALVKSDILGLLRSQFPVLIQPTQAAIAAGVDNTKRIIEARIVAPLTALQERDRARTRAEGT